MRQELHETWLAVVSQHMDLRARGVVDEGMLALCEGEKGIAMQKGAVAHRLIQIQLCRQRRLSPIHVRNMPLLTEHQQRAARAGIHGTKVRGEAGIAQVEVEGGL